MNNENESFFKPVLSTLGLIFSFLAAITPLLPISSITGYFILGSLASPSSIVAVIIGTAITWLVMNFYPFIQWRIGSWRLGMDFIIWVFLLFSLLFFSLFFGLWIVKSNQSLIQALSYILFFQTVIFVFAALVSHTKNRFDYLEQRSRQTETIFSALEKNRLVNPGIKILVNDLLDDNERQQHQVREFGICRKVKVETMAQKLEQLEVVMTHDYSQVIKIISRREILDKNSAE